MTQLTQEVAEWCAKACGWLYKKINGYWYWIKFAPGARGYKTSDLPLDPYFWRPRLEDRLWECCRKANAKAAILEGGILFFPDEKTGIIIDGATHDCPCLALCEAIEKLTKEG